MTRRLINIGLVFSLVILFLWTTSSLPSFNGASNCGGNSAALTYCSQYALMAKIHAIDRADHHFSLDHKFDESELDTLTQLSEPKWIGDGEYLILTTPVDLSATPKKELLIVCNKSFTNVPPNQFWSFSRTYAAGYSDGTAELISPEEFGALDKSKFISVTKFLAKRQ